MHFLAFKGNFYVSLVGWLSRDQLVVWLVLFVWSVGQLVLEVCVVVFVLAFCFIWSFVLR